MNKNERINELCDNVAGLERRVRELGDMVIQCEIDSNSKYQRLLTHFKLKEEEYAELEQSDKKYWLENNTITKPVKKIRIIKN